MTVNERLFAAGLLDAFDDAVAHCDEVQLRSVLSRLYLDHSDIEAIVMQCLAAPK